MTTTVVRADIHPEDFIWNNLPSLADHEQPFPTVTSGDTQYTSALRFEDLDLSDELLKGLYTEMKFERPSTMIKSLPLILTPPHKNLICQAHNGSGKTNFFVLGMFSRVDPKLAAPQALCICPTSERAIQIAQNMEVVSKMGKFTGITSELGIPANKADYIPVSKRAPVTAQVIIGTPGRINKWIAAKKLGTSSLKVLVFDDSDLMLAEGGLKEDSVRIMKDIAECSPKCQVLLFSATFNDTVKAFASKVVNNYFKQGYNELSVNKEEPYVKQYKVNVPEELPKIMIIMDYIMDIGDKIGQTIIFVKTRQSAGMLHEAFVKFGPFGYEVTTIHSGLTQEERDKIVKEFKDGLTRVLISTDKLARGYDESHVNLVINYDLPVVHDDPTEPDNEIYLHCVGIAGWFSGRKGAVLNLLYGDEDNQIMRKIESHINHYVTKVPSWNNIEDFTDDFKKAGLM